MIVGRLIVRHSSPVHRLGCKMGLREASDHVAVPSFRIGVLLVDKGNAADTAHEGSNEIVVGQIAFKSYLLFALTIEEEHSRCPDRTKAVEPYRMFLDVSFYWKEIFVDELGSFLVFIRLGIQPSTSSSSRSRAEIQQEGTGLLFRCG